MRTALLVLGVIAGWAWLIGAFFMANYVCPLSPEARAFLIIMFGIILPLTIAATIDFSRRG